MTENTKKYIGFAVLVVVLAGGFFLISKKNVEAPITGPEEEVPDVVGGNGDEKPDEPSNNTGNLTAPQLELLAKLEKSVKDRNFETFPDLLLEVYKNGWQNKKEFTAQESALYVYATNEYWVKGDLAKTLEVSTKVYNKVPEGWRFRYLRVVVLEKYGRNAFNAGDLTVAENYAMTMLQMMFRPEGANLMGDIYIAKINKNIADGNTTLAKQNLGYIWDFEVSADRRTTLNNLKTQLGL